MTGRDQALQHLERELAVLVRRARRVIAKRAAEVHPDLQPGAYLMLGHIRLHQPLRAVELCEVFDIDKAAVSRQVQHLLDLELVARTPDPEDGRASLISVTPDGERRMLAVRDHERKMRDERLGEWTVAEIEELAARLGDYNVAVERP